LKEIFGFTTSGCTVSRNFGAGLVDHHDQKVWIFEPALGAQPPCECLAVFDRKSIHPGGQGCWRRL
jgi:hypothetical protein